ncbi:MAG TPA: hypothetical protein VFQ26_09230 [Nitrospiraceae bacterium]|nr:hypothetical protein [Nitrospiraceae bacterium]
MARRPLNHEKHRPARSTAHALPQPIRRAVIQGQRGRGSPGKRRTAFLPPENWYEPQYSGRGYRIVVEKPGAGYRHVLTPELVRQRLRRLPPTLLESLEVVQLSRMTRKKESFPCYGMQWGQAIYLYPIEESLVEQFHRPPRPSEFNDARMYGGRWVQQSGSSWQLVWTMEAIRDFYLNNVLIHELGHLVDQRNTSHRDRERFAEWFAIEMGYKRSQRLSEIGEEPKLPALRRHGRK